MSNKSIKINPIHHSDDVIFWQQVKNGDKKGLESLYLKFSRELFGLGMSIKQDKSFIKDCIHDVFLSIWNTRNRLGKTDNVKLYLFKCLSHKIYREVGKDKKRYSNQCLEDYEEVWMVDGADPDSLAGLTDELKRKKLILALDKLPLRQREIIQYLFFDNQSYENISSIMGSICNLLIPWPGRPSII
ncbi:MAG: sigma-70 family RNA polymerase sigma factor [Cyclobacteriaceae bacterium]